MVEEGTSFSYKFPVCIKYKHTVYIYIIFILYIIYIKYIIYDTVSTDNYAEVDRAPFANVME